MLYSIGWSSAWGSATFPWHKCWYKCLTLRSLLEGKVIAVQNCCNFPWCQMLFQEVPANQRQTVLELGNHGLQMWRIKKHLRLLCVWGLCSVCVCTQSAECGKPLDISLSNPSAKAGSTRAGCPGLCPDCFWISPRRRLHNLPEQTVPVLSHPHSKSVSWCPQGTSCISVYAHCLWCCHWATMVPSLHSPSRYL